jgi:wyosine [tRNA(Phe)-imidazoG37] synthetase (radical SAM superfamily)
MRFVFGPVPSRRLGRSLGVDPVPLKVCNWNCVYCQLGRTSPLTTERSEAVPAEEVVAEVRAVLAERADEVDWVTFVGSGEPTLHARLGWMIREVKALGAGLPVAVITNGALLGDPAVRAELAVADAVMPTISAGDERTFLRLHRPAASLDFAGFVEGLRAFRAEYAGHLWAEVMLVEGQNDGIEELEALARLLRTVRPDAIQIVLPTRPPAVSTVRSPSLEAVRRAEALLGEVAPVAVPTEVPDVVVAVDDLEETLLGLVRRHPMNDRELQHALAEVPAPELDRSLARLAAEGRVQAKERCGKRYWASTPL